MKTIATAFSRPPVVSRPEFGRAAARLHRVDEAACDDACGVHCARRSGLARLVNSTHSMPLSPFSRLRRAPARPASSICGTTPISTPSWPVRRCGRSPAARFRGVEALGLGLDARRRRSPASGFRRQPCGGGAARRSHPFLCRCVHGWLKRSTPQNIVIGGAAGALPPVIGWTASTGQLGPGAARSVPHHLPLDAAAFLGARAQPRGRIRQGGRAYAPGRLRKGSYETPDSDLQRPAGPGFGAAVRRSALQARSMAQPRCSAERFLLS